VRFGMLAGEYDGVDIFEHERGLDVDLGVSRGCLE